MQTNLLIIGGGVAVLSCACSAIGSRVLMFSKALEILGLEHSSMLQFSNK